MLAEDRADQRRQLLLHLQQHAKLGQPFEQEQCLLEQLRIQVIHLLHEALAQLDLGRGRHRRHHIPTPDLTAGPCAFTPASCQARCARSHSASDAICAARGSISTP